MSLRHRAALLVTVPALLVTSGAAYGTCVGYTCVLDTPGSVEPGFDAGGGVQCEYVKEQAPPPSDWQGLAQSPPPYSFIRSKDWGNTYEHRWLFDWDKRVCAELCPHGPSSGVEQCLPDVGSRTAD